MIGWLRPVDPGPLCLGLLASLFVGLTASVVFASEQFDATINVDDTVLQRCGTGELVVYRLFTVGHAALYRERCDVSWTMPMIETAAIVFRYIRDIPAHAFPEAAESMLARNIEDSQLKSQMASRLADFHATYKAVTPGDRYQISFQPTAGLALTLNQERLGRLEDGPLAEMYFSIWLGSKPFDKALKNDLLGR